MVGIVSDRTTGDHSPERDPDQGKPAVDGNPSDPGRPFAELIDSGLHWLVNASVFHPRGLALALHQADDGTVTGWSVQGRGDSPIRVDDVTAQRRFTIADLFLSQTRRRNVLDGSPVDVAEIRRIVDHDPGYVVTREDVRAMIGGTPATALLGVLRMDGGADAYPDEEVRAVAERAHAAFVRSAAVDPTAIGLHVDPRLTPHVEQSRGTPNRRDPAPDTGALAHPPGATTARYLKPLPPIRVEGMTVPREMVEGPAASPRPEDLFCPAHGVVGCRMCARNPSTCATGARMVDRGCEYYAEAGVHWDTCSNRDRSDLVDVPERVDVLPPLDDVEHDRAADQ
jgi:hypothetical protein